MGVMDKNAVLIGFAGFCKSDIILYLSRILYVSGEKVAVIDKSNEQELSFSVPVKIQKKELNTGALTLPGFGNTSLDYVPLNKYSVVLVDFGVNTEVYEDIPYLKVLFIVTDCNRCHTIPLSAWLKNLTVNIDSIRIIRDITPGKIRPGYIDSLLQADQVTNLIAGYEFHLNDMEYSTRLISQYDDIFRFTRIPQDYRSMLIDCMTEIFEKDRKASLKALKKAQIGG